MQKQQFNLQDAFLNQIRKDSIPATFFLINGFKLNGIIKGFDNFTVMIEVDKKQQMIYKHAISTIIPIKRVDYMPLDSK